MSLREDLTPEALCLTDVPLAVAMRDAWAEVIGGPYTPWRHDCAHVWPHPDRAVRDRFHARVNALLYARLGMDPDRKSGEDDRAPRRDVPRKPPGRNRLPLPLSDAQILQRYQEGATTTALGDRCGVSAETIRRILLNYEVPMRTFGTFLSDAARDRLVAAYRAGASMKTLARTFNLRERRVRDELATRGVPLRSRSAAQTLRHQQRAA